MMESPVARANAKREQLQAQAAAMGIDEAYVSVLVDTFYERVRAHELLGPIFDKVIGGEWGAHLAKLKSFWGSVAMYTGQYSGKPVPAHQKLTGVEPWHFNIWLALFRQTLADTAPSQEVSDYFIERAERIAESLKLAMFGFPGLPVKRP